MQISQEVHGAQPMTVPRSLVSFPDNTQTFYFLSKISFDFWQFFNMSRYFNFVIFIVNKCWLGLKEMKPFTLSFSVFIGSSFSTFIKVFVYMHNVSPKYHLHIKQSIYLIYILKGQMTWKVSRVIHHFSLSKNVCTCWAAPPAIWEFSSGLWGWAEWQIALGSSNPQPQTLSVMLCTLS